MVDHEWWDELVEGTERLLYEWVVVVIGRSGQQQCVVVVCSSSEQQECVIGVCSSSVIGVWDGGMAIVGESDVLGLGKQSEKSIKLLEVCRFFVKQEFVFSNVVLQHYVDEDVD